VEISQNTKEELLSVVQLT